MQLNKITLKGFGPFNREVSLDLDSLNGPLVAITGEIGAGKTTLLEVGFGGAIYRNCPTRQSLVNLAGDDRGAYVESIVTHGRRYRIRQLVDAVSKKGESSIVDDLTGEILTTSGKLTEFDSFIETHFPSEAVSYASIFMPQGFGGFLDLKPTERKAILNRVLGIEHYEELAEQARERAKAVRLKLENARARLAELADKQSVQDAEYEAAMQKTFADECDAALQERRTALTTAREDAERIRAEIKRLTTESERRGEISQRLAALQTSLEILQTKLKNNRELLADRETVEAAVKRLEKVNEALATAGADRERLTAEVDAAGRKVNDLIQQSSNAESNASQARQRVARFEVILRVADDVTKAVEALPALETALQAAEDAERTARGLVETLTGEKVDSLSDRVKNLRTGLTTIRDAKTETGTVQSLMKVAGTVIATDDEAVTAADEHPAKVQAAREALTAATIAVKQCRDDQTAAERLAGRAGEIENSAKEMETAQREGIEQDEAVRNFSAEARNVQTELEGKKADLAKCKSEIWNLDQKKIALLQVTKSADKLAGADARGTEYEAQEITLQADIAAAELELKDITPADMPPEPNTTAEEQQVTLAETVAREAFSSLAIAQTKVKEAEETAARRVKLETERDRLDIEFADWQRLAEDLGRDGLQALEIDAAGPELSETINDLLRTCIGSRWTVSIETTRASSDKKRQIEGCEVEITDNERPNGKPRPGDSFSGGERVLIGEAISDAFSIFMLRRAGVTNPTLVRDESGAALSAEFIPKWITMLRRVAEIVGASKILYVSHNVEAQELADSIVRVNGDASISVVR